VGALFKVGAAGAIFREQLDLGSPCAYFNSSFQIGHQAESATAVPLVMTDSHAITRALSSSGESTRPPLSALTIPNTDQSPKLATLLLFGLPELL
jgi:hypothetical protein